MKNAVVILFANEWISQTLSEFFGQELKIAVLLRCIIWIDYWDMPLFYCVWCR